MRAAAAPGRRTVPLRRTVAISLFLALGAAALSGCTSIGARQQVTASAGTPAAAPRTMFSVARYGTASPRVVADNQPVPRGGGRDMVGRPYQVAGRWYTPKEDPNYRVVGMASWYGADFHGRRTANGEVYDMNALTAAHTTMPLPSYARVTNLQNGHSLMVRVNDRGPFHSNRVIDVSARAAEMLGMQSSGVAQVQVEYVGRAPVDPHDERILMASYTEGRPGTVPSLASSVQLALAAGASAVANTTANAVTSTAAAVAATVQLAMNTPAGPPAARAAPPLSGGLGAVATARRPLALYNPFATGQADAMFTPAAMTQPDPLATIIAGAPNANLFAALPLRTGAQNAADALAAGGRGMALDQSAALRGTSVPEDRHIANAGSARAVIEVGAFADRANVDRIAVRLAAFGTVGIAETVSDGRPLWSVTLAAADADAETALNAAIRAGAIGARFAD